GSTTRNGHGQVATNSASSQRRASRNIHDVSAILATAILREHLALRALRSAAVTRGSNATSERRPRRLLQGVARNATTCAQTLGSTLDGVDDDRRWRDIGCGRSASSSASGVLMRQRQGKGRGKDTRPDTLRREKVIHR